MFSQYVRLCLTRKYADFHSRASRVEYLCFIGMSFMLHSLIMYLELAVQFFVGPQPVFSEIFIWLRGLLYLFLIVPAAAVHARRIHDTGKTAGYLIVLLILGILPNLFLLISILKNTFLEFITASMLAEYIYALFFTWLEHGFLAILTVLTNMLFEMVIRDGMDDMTLLSYGTWFATLLFIMSGLTVLMLRPGTRGENHFGPEPEKIPDMGKGIVFAVSNCLLHGYARFSGRATRSEYWWFVLASTLTVGSISFFRISAYFPYEPYPLLLLIALLPQLPILIPGLAVLIRRLHDRGKGILWFLGLLVIHLILTFLAFFILYESYAARPAVILSLCLMLLMPAILLLNLILPGTKEANRYGPVPWKGELSD